MTADNWRTHIIVKCAKCKKPMAFHTETETAVCNTCFKPKEPTQESYDKLFNDK